MKNKLTHNLGLKIMAVLCAVLLWMVATDINNPVDRKYIYNVSVQLLNAGSITKQDKTYKVLNNSDSVRVTVRAQKSVLTEISDKNITAKADCSKLTPEGTVPIEVTVNDKYLDNKIESVQADKEFLQLEIEDKITKQLSIEVIKNGTLPEGYVTGRVSTETNMMSISGPESAIAPVARAVVEVSMSGVSSDVDILANIRLLDEDGNEVTNYGIRKSIESVKVTVPILKTKEVPVIFSKPVGTPADGYVLQAVKMEPQTIVIAGRDTALDNIEQIELSDEELDITGAVQTITNAVDIRKYLPADVSLSDHAFNGYVILTAEIEAVRHKSVSIAENAVQILNVPQGWQADLLPGQNLRVSITGLQENLDTVNEETITPHTDISALFNADGTALEGEQEITIKVLLPASVKQEETVTALIRLTKLPEE